MGGSIKEGVMHGIREPHKHGGLSQQFNTGLVGDERYPKTKGREHHFGFLAPLYWAGQAALRLGPAAYRGWKASRALTPWAKDLGKWGRFKDIFLPKKSLRLQTGTAEHAAKHKAGEGLGFGIGSFTRSNPLTTIGLASMVPQGAYLAGKGIKAAPGALWSGAKRYADMVIPGDQSHWWKDKEPPKGVPDPNLQKKKKLSTAAKKEFALEQRENRVNRYLELMGYDRAKKTAIADALIDASKIVSDRGTLDKKNINRELINPIIQAMSKRLDKPDQIREAVGLMATKAEIEKDLEDPSIKALRLEQLKELRGGFSKDIGDFILSAKGSKVKPKALEQYARARANRHDLDFTVVTDEMIAKAGPDATEDEKIQAVVSGDGVYMIGDAIIQVTGGVPKRIA
jgi:hypothetical protein